MAVIFSVYNLNISEMEFETYRKEIIAETRRKLSTRLGAENRDKPGYEGLLDRVSGWQTTPEDITDVVNEVIARNQDDLQGRRKEDLIRFLKPTIRDMMLGSFLL